MKSLALLAALTGMMAVSSRTTAAVITWSTSPALGADEVETAGSQVWAYSFSAAAAANPTVNGVTFTNTVPVGTIAVANALTPGFERFGTDSFGESSDEFYLGPDIELNQILDGLTWGGNNQFQLTGLTTGQNYVVQIFSSDDRATWINRVLDIDSSWATPNGSRQLENVDYTAGGPWVDPAGRSKIFLGSFVADGPTQQISALIDDGGTGQIDLNAIQLRLIPEPATALVLVAGLAGAFGLRRRRW